MRAPRPAITDNPDQRISEDVGGFISGAGPASTHANAGIYNYTIQAMTTATNLVAFSIILWGISRNMDIAGVRHAEFPDFCSGSPSSTPSSPPA